jgi:hypothetical protein
MNDRHLARGNSREEQNPAYERCDHARCKPGVFILVLGFGHVAVERD